MEVVKDQMIRVYMKLSHHTFADNMPGSPCRKVNWNEEGGYYCTVLSVGVYCSIWQKAIRHQNLYT